VDFLEFLWRMTIGHAEVMIGQITEDGKIDIAIEKA